MSDERAMSEDEIETMAWQLESKMMEIRRDPRAALAAGLGRIWSTMHAETKAYWEKKLVERHAIMAEHEAKLETKLMEAEATLETELAKRVANLDALFAAELEKRVAKLNASFAAEEAKVKAELDALTADTRAAHADLDRCLAEPDPPQSLQ